MARYPSSAFLTLFWLVQKKGWYPCSNLSTGPRIEGHFASAPFKARALGFSEIRAISAQFLGQMAGYDGIPCKPSAESLTMFNLRFDSIGVLFRLICIDRNGFHWFRWVSFHLPGAIYCSKTPMFDSACGKQSMRVCRT